jgi:hypothetical protein
VTGFSKYKSDATKLIPVQEKDKATKRQKEILNKFSAFLYLLVEVTRSVHLHAVCDGQLG